MESQEPLAVNTATACKLLGISRSTLYRELKLGRLVASKAGKRTLFKMEALKGWLNALP